MSIDEKNDQIKTNVERKHPQHWCGQHKFETSSSPNFYKYTSLEDKEKSAMCRVAEIARFNKLRHFYDLLDESGPAHRKLFTVKLVLTADETFEGSGSSIKRAQQASAENAIQNTKLPLPSDKPARKKKIESSKPHRVLQNVCRILQYSAPQYISCNPPVYPDPGCSTPEHILLPPSAVAMYGLPFSSSPIDPARPHGPKLQAVIVSIDGKSIATGVGDTYPLAKQDGALKALIVLSPLLKNHKDAIMSENEDGCFDQDALPKHKQRSVISDIHEKAHQLKLNVVFEVLKEEGPPHDRSYLVRCAFVTSNNVVKAEATGTGRKKKTAQQEACAELLKIVEDTTPEVNPIALANNVCKTQRKLSSLYREPKRKTIVKDKKMDPLYGHQINPVSRLIQVTQTKNQDHPSFELVSEQGVSKYKEFTIRVRCGEDICDGKGPNKRLAKRAAAEAMLELIGYVKPLPEPGKSLLKKVVEPSEEEPRGSSDKSNDQSQQNTIQSDSESNQLETERNIDSALVESQANKKEEPQDNEKRRVTFNSQVHACPPPGDQDYPHSIVSDLKKDAVVEGKCRKIKRSKENRRSLSQDQILEVSEQARKSLDALRNNKESDATYSAQYYLEQLSETFKFGVMYTTFPDPRPAHHFTIVTLQLEDPLVGYGTGDTASEAGEEASFAALVKLEELSSS